MKKLIVLSLVAVFFTAMFSCKKYEEGPAVSLRTKKARLCQTWRLSKAFQDVQVGEEDLTDNYPIDWEITYKKDGTWSSISNGNDNTGKWEFDSKKESIRVTTDGAPSEIPEVFDIVKLKKDEFWYTQTVFDEVIEFHWVPK